MRAACARTEKKSADYEKSNNRACVVLYGLGGIGKTQLAIEYIRRHKEKYTAIFWLNANSQDSLKLSFRDVARQVTQYHPLTSLLAGVDMDNLDQVIYAVKAWFDL
jgi:GTPase SAR1 family protein